MTPLAVVTAPMAEPALEPDSKASRPSKQAKQHRRAPRAAVGRVLVLDAEDDRRELLADVITRAGGEHDLVATGADAIRRLQTPGIECVLVAGLPDGTRQAFVAWARPRYPNVAIVAIAEHVEHATELYNAGADVVTMLPIDPDLLGAKLAAAIRGAQRPRLRLV